MSGETVIPIARNGQEVENQVVSFRSKGYHCYLHLAVKPGAGEAVINPLPEELFANNRRDWAIAMVDRIMTQTGLLMEAISLIEGFEYRA